MHPVSTTTPAHRPRMLVFGRGIVVTALAVSTLVACKGDELIDPVTLRVKMDNYHPVGRLFANQYTRTNDRFCLEANAYLERMAAAGRT